MVGIRFAGRLKGIEIYRSSALPYVNNEGEEVHFVELPYAKGMGFFVSPDWFRRLSQGTEPPRVRFVD